MYLVCGATKFKNMRLYPLLATVIAASTSLCVSESASGETSNPSVSVKEPVIQNWEALRTLFKASQPQSVTGKETLSPAAAHQVTETVKPPEVSQSQARQQPQQNLSLAAAQKVTETITLPEVSKHQARSVAPQQPKPSLSVAAAKQVVETVTLPEVSEPQARQQPQQNLSLAVAKKVTKTVTLPEVSKLQAGIAQKQTPESANPSQPQTQSPRESQPQTPNQSQSQPPQVLVSEVVVRGVTGELENIAYEAASVQPGETTTRSQLQQDVNAIFATGYFSNVEVEPEDTPRGVRINFVVEPNPTLSNVEVQTVTPQQGDRVIPQQVVDEIFGGQYGQILNLRQLQENIKRLNQWYQERGYTLAQVVGSPEVSEDGTVTLRVAEGVIEDIQVNFIDEQGEPTEGRTRDFIITRELELSPGDVFNRQTARQDLRRLFRLGILEDARFSFEPAQDPSKVIVNANVVEGQTGSVGAGAGFSSETGLFGTLSYQEQNLGGNDQDLGVEFQLGTRSLLFDVSFTDPWIAGDPFRTSYTVDAFRRRSISLVFEGGDREVQLCPEDNCSENTLENTSEDVLEEGDRPRVVRTGSGVTFTRPLGPDPFTEGEWLLSAGLEYQRVSTRDGDGDLSPEDALGNQLAFSEDGTDDLITLEFDATRDLRNNRLQPTDGSLLRVGVDQSVPIGSGTIFMNRLRGSYSYYLPTDLTNFSDGPETFAFNIQAGTVLGDLPPYEAFALGGSNSVRGYDIGELGSGRSYVQATAEYRFPIVAVIGGALFLDYGSDLGTADDVLGDPAVVRDKPGSGFGYGAGVRIQSPLGPIRIDYAFNDEGESQLHFGIGERF